MALNFSAFQQSKGRLSLRDQLRNQPVPKRKEIDFLEKTEKRGLWTMTKNIGSAAWNWGKNKAVDFAKDQARNVSDVLSGRKSVFSAVSDIAKLPAKATWEVAKFGGKVLLEIPRGAFRFGGKLALTGVEAATGEKWDMNFEDSFWRHLYGTENLTSFQTSAEQGAQIVEALGGTKGNQQVLPWLGIAVGSILDFTPVGGTAKKTVTQIAKEATSEGVEQILKQSAKGLADDTVKELAPVLAKTTDKKVIQETIETALRNDDIYSGLRKQATDADTFAAFERELFDVKDRAADMKKGQLRVFDTGNQLVMGTVERAGRKELTVKTFSRIGADGSRKAKSIKVPRNTPSTPTLSTRRGTDHFDRIGDLFQNRQTLEKFYNRVNGAGGRTQLPKSRIAEEILENIDELPNKKEFMEIKARQYMNDPVLKAKHPTLQARHAMSKKLAESEYRLLEKGVATAKNMAPKPAREATEYFGSRVTRMGREITEKNADEFLRLKALRDLNEVANMPNIPDARQRLSDIMQAMMKTIAKDDKFDYASALTSPNIKDKIKAIKHYANKYGTDKDVAQLREAFGFSRNETLRNALGKPTSRLQKTPLKPRAIQSATEQATDLARSSRPQKNIASLTSLDNKSVKLNNKNIIAQAADDAKDVGVSIIKDKDTFMGRTFSRIKNSEPFVKFQEGVQDNWVRVKRLMEKEGVKFADDSNPYQEQQLFHGIVGALEEDVEKRLRDINRAIVKLAKKDGIEPPAMRQQVNDFLYARHAIERNAALGDNAAGITTQKAKEMLAAIDGNASSKAIKESAEQLQQINNEVLDILLDGEVISESLHKTLRERYKTHVPLNRIIDDEADEIFEDVLGAAGLKIKGAAPIRKAKGSDLEVADIQANIIASYKQAIERAQKNKVNLATYKMAKENDMFGGTFTEWKPKAIGTDFKGRPILQQVDDPLVLPFRLKGEQKYLRINDLRLAKAFQGVAKDQLPAAVRAIGVVTRFYSSMATRFNPEFAFSNIVRDSQDLFVNMFAMRSGKSAVKSTARTPKSATDIMAWLAGKDTEGARLYKQMRADGGTTGGLGLSTRREIELDVKSIVGESENVARRMFNKTIRGVDNYNRVFEDATRLSAYKQALEDGLSRKQAAFIAKNATFNFNTKGSAGAVINSLYMFANASIQGSIRTIRSLRNPKVAGVTVGLMGAATWTMHGHNDSIDPDWRSKVSPYDLKHSMIWVLPPDEDGTFRYTTIPVSWGLKPVKIMMDRAYEGANGRSTDVGEAIGDVTSSFWDAYNPAGGTDFMSTITPSILDIPLDVARNKAWHGGMIYPDWMEGLPASEQVFSDTQESLRGKTAIEISKQLEKIGVEQSPEVFEYVFDQLIGGAGRSIQRTAETTTATATGNLGEVNPRELFLINRFYKEQTPERVQKMQKKAAQKELQEDLKNIKDPVERKDTIRDYIRDMEREDAQSVLFKLDSIGFDVKGISFSENPRRPKITDDYDAWYAYYRSRKFNYTRDEAREFAEGMVGSANNVGVETKERDEKGDLESIFDLDDNESEVRRNDNEGRDRTQLKKLFEF